MNPWPQLVIADLDGWGHMAGGEWGMMVFGLMFMTLLVALVVWLFWSTSRRTEASAATGRGALDVLDARYARGEIDRDDYLERKADLER